MREDALTQEYLLSILDYDPEAGVFVWRARTPRARYERTDKGWNTRRAGTEAGGVNVHGYVMINLFGIPKYVHRLAFLWMTGETPAQIDHIDTNRANNRWSNLRPTTDTGNRANTFRRSDNTSGIKGVCWDRQRLRWFAQLHISGRHIFLGYHDRKEDAALAYAAGAARYFGEFARSA